MRKLTMLAFTLLLITLGATACNGSAPQQKEEEDVKDNGNISEAVQEEQPKTEPEVFDEGLSLTVTEGNVVGTWWWDISLIKSESVKYLDFCAQNGVTDIYLSAYNRAARGVSDADLAVFIRAAAERSIRVSYLAGDAGWIRPDNTGFEKITADFSAYQEKALDAEKFYALHLDVEPHQLDEFKTDRPTVMQQFADYIINRAYAFTSAAGVPLYMDIPFWLSDTVKDADGSETVLADLCAEYCDVITIMSYRDTADKMLEVSKEELEFAQKRGCGIILGAECYSEEGNQVSYLEEGKAYMYGELKKVSEALSEADGTSLHGIAVHNIKTWFSLFAE